MYRSGGRHGGLRFVTRGSAGERYRCGGSVLPRDSVVCAHEERASPYHGRELTPRQGFAYISGRAVVVHHSV